MKVLAMIIARFSKRMGIVACGAASIWGGYQTKEPKNVFEK